MSKGPYKMRKVTELHVSNRLIDGVRLRLECGHDKRERWNTSHAGIGNRVRCYECGVEDAESPLEQP